MHRERTSEHLVSSNKTLSDSIDTRQFTAMDTEGKKNLIIQIIAAERGEKSIVTISDLLDQEEDLGIKSILLKELIKNYQGSSSLLRMVAESNCTDLPPEGRGEILLALAERHDETDVPFLFRHLEQLPDEVCKKILHAAVTALGRQLHFSFEEGKGMIERIFLAATNRELKISLIDAVAEHFSDTEATTILTDLYEAEYWRGVRAGTEEEGVDYHTFQLAEIIQAIKDILRRKTDRTSHY